MLKLRFLRRNRNGFPTHLTIFLAHFKKAPRFSEITRPCLFIRKLTISKNHKVQRKLTKSAKSFYSFIQDISLSGLILQCGVKQSIVLCAAGQCMGPAQHKTVTIQQSVVLQCTLLCGAMRCCMVLS